MENRSSKIMICKSAYHKNIGKAVQKVIKASKETSETCSKTAFAIEKNLKKALLMLERKIENIYKAAWKVVKVSKKIENAFENYFLQQKNETIVLMLKKSKISAK